ncbi:hypothetical protein SLE2022_002060 [Rubroshorea leprosula]
MDNRKENATWMSVPQFGGWDRISQGVTNYSKVFSQARAKRKQQKSDARHSIGNEEELVATTLPPQEDDSIMRKRKILTYINCCTRP